MQKKFQLSDKKSFVVFVPFSARKFLDRLPVIPNLTLTSGPVAHLGYQPFMIWENTKLLLGLLYRPVSSMGRIVDEGHWLYAAIVVAALSMVFHATVTSVINQRDEAREVFNRCVEAVKTMPSYRYREQRKWDKLARERLAAKQPA
jgi:hypothetical protein